MGRPGPLAAFLLRLALIYALLILLWPLWGEGYAAAYRAGSNAVASALGIAHHVSVLPLADAQREAFAGQVSARDLALDDTRIFFQAGGRELTVLHSARYSGYIPTALLVALILATPVQWAFRLRALAWGLVLLALYLGVRMGATFIVDGALDPFSWLPAPGVRRSVLLVLAVTGPGSGPWYVVPFLIWLLLVQRRVYRELILGSAAEPQAEEPQAEEG
jgi:hypothetical protein